MKTFIHFLSIVGISLSLASCQKTSGPRNLEQNKDTIRIGEVQTLTGSEASYGISIHRGIQLVIDEVNAKGGVRGKKIEVITLDDQGKAEEAATATTKLITQEKVLAVMGAVTSSRSLAMGPIAEKYKIPMLTPTGTNPRVTLIGPHVFRTCFVDAFQGGVMAKFALHGLKAKKAAILRDVKSDYSVGLAEFFSLTFKKGGGEVLMEQSFSAGDIDFKAQLTAIRARNPDFVFIPAYYSDAGLIARQARELGIHVPLLGTDGWDSPKLIEIAGAAANHSFFSNHYANDNSSPEVTRFATLYKTRFNEMPDGISALGYDTAQLIVDAISRASDLTPDSIREALSKTKDFMGVTGKITMDQNRNPMKSAVILKIEEGLVKYRETIHPDPL